MAAHLARGAMIARVWRGATAAVDGDAYADYLEVTGVRQYRRTPGNRGVLVLRHEDGHLARFTVISLWASPDAIRTFAGEDVERAVFYPEDERFLVERDLAVTHRRVDHLHV